VVPLIGEQPGVFGWLIMRSSEDGGGCTSREPLATRRSAPIVGVYDDTANSEMEEPGGDRSSDVFP